MGEVSDGLQAVLSAIEAQQQSIERLIATLEKTARDAAAADDVGHDLDGDKPTAINWMDIRGAPRLAAWQGLATFVEALVAEFDLQLTIRPCWWQHSEAVDELTALWHFHQHTYADPTKLDAAMNWRDTFCRSRDRLRDVFVSCRDMHVNMRLAVTWMNDEVRREFQTMIEGDVRPLSARMAPSPRTIWTDSPIA